MPDDLLNRIKGLVVYLAGVILLFFFFSLIFKDQYADLSKSNYMLYEVTAFWALLIYAFFCVLYFLLWTFYLVGSYQHDMYEGVLFGFIVTLLYLAYFVGLYRVIFVHQSYLPF